MEGTKVEKNQRNLVTAALLGIVTIGFYWLYWIYKVTEFTNEGTQLEKRSPVGQMLLCLIPFYDIFWYYQTSKSLDAMMADNNRTDDNDILAILLMFFGGIFIAGLVMQDRINKVITMKTGSVVKKSLNGSLVLGVVMTLLLTLALILAGLYLTPDELFADDDDYYSEDYDMSMDEIDYDSLFSDALIIF